MISVRKEEFELQDPNNAETYCFVYFPVSYNYFTIFDNSTTKIECLENVGLINLIICSYADIKGLFENLKDSAKTSQEFEKYNFNNAYNKKIRQLIFTHYNYAKFILEKQVPTIEKVIDELIQNIENELLIQNKNTIIAFLNEKVQKINYLFAYIKKHKNN